MLFDKDEKWELLRENQQLKRQLEKAKALISSLYRQIDELKAQIHQIHQQQNSISPQTPKMHIQEQFENSSDEQSIVNSVISPRVKFKGQNLNLSTSIDRQGGNFQLRKANTKIIYNSEECVTRKSIQKLLKKSSQRHIQQDSQRRKQSCLSKKNQYEQDQFSIKAMSTRDIHVPLPPLRRQFSTVRSEKVLFKKTTSSKPIFEHFFVTGFSKQGPSILFSYPQRSQHDFGVYLSILYGQNFMRGTDLSPCNSRSKITPNGFLREAVSQGGKRDCYVIPILKANSQVSQRDFLIVVENQELVSDKNQSPILFNRCYCFLSQWKFFNQFRKLTSLIVDSIQSKRRTENLNQSDLAKLISQQLGPSLSFLHQKSTDYNKTIDCCIGESGLRFSADVPPMQSSFQLVDKFLVNRLISTPAFIKVGEEDVIQTKLFGPLLAYTLTETKIILYSNSKTRISETVLELLELIKPLSYVNPVIVGALREHHETYLDAPMGLIMGLWTETRKSNKQKIQIFMNRKLNLAGLIEKAKLQISDGVVVNLDTGLLFGGGINTNINSIGLKLNSLGVCGKNNRNMRDYYKFVERMLGGRGQSEQARLVWSELMVQIQKTQLYCYYLENREIDL